MSLKTHLIIVGLIILGVFVGWRLIELSRPDPTAEVQNERAIMIIRASWGMNCLSRRGLVTQQGVGDFQEKSETEEVRENNVLQKISELCNLQQQCTIRNMPLTFGFEPLVACQDKQLDVEYRCFSYDRPWVMTVKARETGVIDCSKARLQ